MQTEEFKGAFPPLEIKQLKKENLAHVSARYPKYIIDGWESVFKSVNNSNKNATIQEGIKAVLAFSPVQVEIFKRIPLKQDLKKDDSKNVQYRISKEIKDGLIEFVKENKMTFTDTLCKIKVLIIENHTIPKQC